MNAELVVGLILALAGSAYVTVAMLAPEKF